MRRTRSDSRWNIVGVISVGSQMNCGSKTWDLLHSGRCAEDQPWS